MATHSLRRYIDENGQFNAVVVDLTGIGQDLYKTLNPSPIALHLLVQAMGGALMMVSNLKDRGTMLFKFDGDGPAQSITVEANTMYQVRGCLPDMNVFFELEEGVGLFQQAIGAGVLNSKRRTEPSNNVFSSVVPLVQGEIPMNYANYLLQSVQTNSAINIGVQLDPELGVVGAGGVLIQALPGAEDNLLFILEQRIQEIGSLGSFFAEENGSDKVVEWLFEGIDVKLLKEDPVSYHCSCTRQRMFQVLSTLAMEELKAMQREDRDFEISCSFCGKAYKIATVDMDAIVDAKENPA